jgi:uncharacterized cupredoxin-like copper-binding protein
MSLFPFARLRLVLAGVLLLAGSLLVACGDTAPATTAPAAAPTATTAPAAAEPTATTAAPAAGEPTATTATGGSGGTAAGSPIVVTLNEWSIEPKSIQAPAGHQTFKVTNAGKLKHNFSIIVNGQEVKTANLGNGETAMLEADIPAGTYDTLCDIPGHKQQGMAGTLEIK